MGMAMVLRYAVQPGKVLIQGVAGDGDVVQAGAVTDHRSTGPSAPVMVMPAPLVARQQREQRRAAAPVLPQGHQPGRAQRAGSGRERGRAERPAPQDAGLASPLTSQGRRAWYGVAPPASRLLRTRRDYGNLKVNVQVPGGRSCPTRRFRRVRDLWSWMW